MAQTDERVSGWFAVRNRQQPSTSSNLENADEHPIDLRAVAVAASLIGLAIGATVATALLGIPT
jgi:hypothetical protein